MCIISRYFRSPCTLDVANRSESFLSCISPKGFATIFPIFAVNLTATRCKHLAKITLFFYKNRGILVAGSMFLFFYPRRASNVLSIFLQFNSKILRLGVLIKWYNFPTFPTGLMTKCCISLLLYLPGLTRIQNGLTGPGPDQNYLPR